MRDPKRIDEILEKFGKLWKQFPDQRFGQVFENYLLSNKNRGDGTSCELFFTEDDKYELILNKILKKEGKK